MTQQESPPASATPASLDATCATTDRYERVAVRTGAWTDRTTWGGSPVPRASHDVCVPGGVVVTLADDVAGTAASVNGNGTIRVAGNAGTSLTVGNSLYHADSWIGALDISGPGLPSAPGVRGHANLSVGTLRWSGPPTAAAKQIKGVGSLSIRTAWDASGDRPLVMRRAVTVEPTAAVTFDGPVVRFTGPRSFVNHGTVSYTASMIDFGAGYRVQNHGRFELGSGPPLPATSAEMNVPATVDASGATDVTAALQAFVDSVPDGGVAAFAPGATYRVEGTILVSGRESLTIDGNGATFVARTDGSSAAPPRGMFATKWPRRRVHFMVDGGSDITLRELTVRGGHPQAGMSDEAYIEELEGQHGVEFRGVVGGGLHQCEISDVYGDFVSVSGGATDIVVSDCRMARNGRQGISVTDAHDVVVERNVIADVRRSAVDVEPATDTWSVSRVTVRDNDIGPFRLMALASKGAGGSVRDIALEHNRFVGSPLQVYAGAARGARRGTYRVVGNTSDTPFGSPNAAMRFFHIDGVQVRDNVQALNPDRSGIGVSTVESCAVDVGGNSFPGGTVELATDDHACPPPPAPVATPPAEAVPAVPRPAPLAAGAPPGDEPPLVTVGNGSGTAGAFTNERGGVVAGRGGRAAIAMTTSNDGAVELGGSGLTFGAGLTNVDGRITVPATAALVVTGGDFVQTGPAGTTRVDGALRVAAGHLVDVRDGILKGDGAIVADTVRNAGILQPGSGAPASLVVAGHFEQAPGGTSRFTVRGGVADSLAVAGRATLGGRLLVATVGAPPARGTVLPVLSYASTVRSYDDLWGTLGSAGSGLVYAPAFGPATLALTVADVPSVTVTAVSVAATSATFTLTRTGTAAVPATVEYRTDVPGDATAATPDVDFATRAGVATFAVGVTVQKVTVPIHADDAVELDEVFWLRLRRTPHGQVAGASAVAVAVIPGDPR